MKILAPIAVGLIVLWGYYELITPGAFFGLIAGVALICVVWDRVNKGE